MDHDGGGIDSSLGVNHDGEEREGLVLFVVVWFLWWEVFLGSILVVRRVTGFDFGGGRGF